MVDSGEHVPSSANQGDATSLAREFESLPADYQNVIRSAQHQHGIRVVPLQELTCEIWLGPEGTAPCSCRGTQNFNLTDIKANEGAI